MVFYNRRYFIRQKFEILKSSLKIERKNIFDSIEYEIPFDYLSPKMKIQTVFNNNLIFVGVFCWVFSIPFLFGTAPEFAYILWGFGLLLIILPFINRKKVVSIAAMDGNSIEIYFNNKNKQDVLDYGNEIIQSANQFLLKKLGKIDRSLPIDSQLENIQYLLNREIITEENFENLKNQLLGIDNKSYIGFGHQ